MHNWMTSPFAEERPRVSIRLLKREGILTKPFGDVVINTAGVDVRVTVMCDSYALFAWKDEGRLREQEVTLCDISLRFGSRRAFQCRASLQPCFDLYLTRYGWVSAKGGGLQRAGNRSGRIGRRLVRLDRIRSRLLGLDGTPKARGANRTRLLAELRGIPFGTWHIPEAEFMVFDHDQAKRLEAAKPFRSRRANSPHSTEAALAAGSSDPFLGSDSAMASLLLERAASSELSQLDTDSLSRRPLKVLETSAALDARVLSKLLPRDRPWCRTLIWPPSAMEGATRFVLAADLTDRSAPRLAIKRTGPTGSAWQSVNVRRSSDYKPNNLVFVCPVLGTRHDVLFLRDGFFASPKAQRLVHRSQRA